MHATKNPLGYQIRRPLPENHQLSSHCLFSLFKQLPEETMSRQPLYLTFIASYHYFPLLLYPILTLNVALYRLSLPVLRLKPGSGVAGWILGLVGWASGLAGGP